MSTFSVAVLRPEEDVPDSCSEESRATILAFCAELSQVPFFGRSAADTFARFWSRLLASRCTAGSRVSTQVDDYVAHVACMADGLSAVTLCHPDVRPAQAHAFLSRVLTKYITEHGVQWTSVQNESKRRKQKPLLPLSCLGDLLHEFNASLAQGDSMARIEREIDLTRGKLEDAIQQACVNMAEMDALVKTSQELSDESKSAWIKSKKLKRKYRCCVIM
ncbi:MAG: hypothetical protein MHM6MM_005414 [Cercozoa sp. M6MM]